MKTSEYIEDKINKLPKGYVFTYMDFMNEVTRREAIIKHLNRMAASRKINKLSKGKYFKPQETVFGTLLPDQHQIVKDLLEEDGKLVGYITGYSVYNSLGLTTQVSSTIQIGKREIRPSFKRGRFRISFIKQKNTINKENIPLLRLLDAIRYIKKIPDTTIEKSCIRLMALLHELKTSEKIKLIKLAFKYSPATRALLGALLSEMGCKAVPELRDLQDSLNPITVYNLEIPEKVLSNAKYWNIK
ncbi:hypothetical protein HME9304_02874 [Flagellimonas maritima]|uniref:AbiEi antitoxin C-terminal domain-containing protein n=1 Tax=Flagellimonas maritima TaxID=1383885 RepID=A0A2Z4LWE8_9FLAO|nr:DUF6088 family protein [Allomuricauda aurantiaca]AWX45844.1 hypothetical protein HME9304_02874 [Allomuricauda aurantiaca]